MKRSNKQFAGYSLMATTLLSLGNHAQAQTIFTDADPDQVLTLLFDEDSNGEDINVDINDDGIDDFRIGVEIYYECVACEPRYDAIIEDLGDNLVGYNTETVYSFCDELPFDDKIIPVQALGALIGDDETFRNWAHLFMRHGHSSCGAPLNGEMEADHAFAPVQIKLAGAMHNGWIRFSGNFVTSDVYELTVHDFAYNATAGATIVTADPVLECSPPEITSSIVSSSVIKLTWAPVPFAESYKLRYKKVGIPGWHNINTSLTSKKITGLDCSSPYQFRLYTLCSDGTTTAVSESSAVYSYTTAACRLGDGQDDMEPTVTVYPNPANENIYISAEGFNAGEIKIDIYNIAGENVKTFSVMNSNELQVDIADLIPGMYTINITDAEKSIAQKFVKQ